ncbi:hypothetical protein BH09BAC6_BH09BAC6_35180 [soil metagenome]|jgi:hypothetical protein
MKRLLFIMLLLAVMSACKKSGSGTVYNTQPPLNIGISNVSATSGYTIKAQNFTQNTFDFNVTGTENKTYTLAVNKGDHLNIFYQFLSRVPGQTQQTGAGELRLTYNGVAIGTVGTGEGNMGIVIP